MSENRPKRLRISTVQGDLIINADGRPDGGPSVLEKYREEYRQLRAQGQPDTFLLDEEAVRALGEEAILYRLRREYFFKHDDFARARRDVAHGIDIIDFVHAHAADHEQRLFYWQFRPDQEIFLRVCLAHEAIDHKDYAAARREIERAMDYVTEFYEGFDQEGAEEALEQRAEFLTDKYREIGELWENDPEPLANSEPPLEDQLAQAVAVEDYERAAMLRDLIHERDAAASS